MSDHKKNPSGSLCAILFHILHLEGIASHRGTCSNKGSSTDFNTDSWLSWNSPKGRWNTDSHNWPFFSSHVTISMSLCFLVKISSHDGRPPATKLSFFSILRDFHLTTAVLCDGSHKNGYQNMQARKLHVLMIDPVNPHFKNFNYETQLFLHRLWGIVESGSVTLQHISRSYQLQGTLPRCAWCSHQGHRYHRTAAPDSFQQLSRPFLLAWKIIGMLQDAFKSHLLCPYWFNLMPLCLLKDSNSFEMMLGLKRPAPECSLHIDWYCLGTQSFPMHICNIPWHSKASAPQHDTISDKQLNANDWDSFFRILGKKHHEGATSLLKQNRLRSVAVRCHFPPATHCTSTSQGLQSSGKRQA